MALTLSGQEPQALINQVILIRDLDQQSGSDRQGGSARRSGQSESDQQGGSARGNWKSGSDQQGGSGHLSNT